MTPLFEDLPDHSGLIGIQGRFGPPVFREFFERIVEECLETRIVYPGIPGTVLEAVSYAANWRG
ncbi:MAG: hypothetical protein L0G70_07655 [Rubrobacter sp.]|nr:hypothetical protein [Rubrobacter sp.]